MYSVITYLCSALSKKQGTYNRSNKCYYQKKAKNKRNLYL